MHTDSPEDYLSRHVQASAEDLSQKIDELIAHTVPPNSPNQALYRDMLLTVIRMAQADRSRWDAKIMMQTLREMEQAFRALEQYKRRRKVTVFGSARTAIDHSLYVLAHKLGKALAQRDMMVITGGGGGIMAAAHEGAGLENSLGFNITLPFEQRANPTIEGTDHVLSFHFFYVRKLFFLKEADALVLCPGGFGTLDETFEVLTLIQTGKSPLVPVVLLDTPDGTFWEDAMAFFRKNLAEARYILPSDLKLATLAHTSEAAADVISRFYSNFHSTRWLHGRFIMRLNHELTPEALTLVNQQFADLCRSGSFTQQPYSEVVPDEPEFAHLNQLSFDFHARNYGRLRELIDTINDPAHWLHKNA
ncbi:hypothetical protein IQ22_01454 [Pseudomonas duriflava]|uniref:AMP nucleosidase n=1 Tax=Pseudomonas duriflava TaxID=459528 RepID=A0A562QH61_9PSED|nr:LOG family protein [Pseudomonas duriflava]TWI55530.1 hypothetical protein IQ22_01454 [Pseudomonas duriflava]